MYYKFWVQMKHNLTDIIWFPYVELKINWTFWWWAQNSTSYASSHVIDPYYCQITNLNLHNITHIHNIVLHNWQYYVEYSSYATWMVEYFVEYCQSCRTMLWISVMLCSGDLKCWFLANVIWSCWWSNVIFFPKLSIKQLLQIWWCSPEMTRS